MKQRTFIVCYAEIFGDDLSVWFLIFTIWLGMGWKLERF